MLPGRLQTGLGPEVQPREQPPADYVAQVRLLAEVNARWRSGTRRSQREVLAVLILGVALSTVVSIVEYPLFPITGFFLWLLLGSLLLRFGPLVILTIGITAAAVAARLGEGEVAGGRTASLIGVVLSAALVLYASSKRRSGLPAPVSEALLSDLRDRLYAQGRVPDLPTGWHSQTAMIAAYGVGYAGDFMVADLDQEAQVLDVVLVDVVGKGVKAAPSALLLAGALGGMIGAMRGRSLFDAANDFLLRQQSVETFATAVHLSIDLHDGRYTILSAGHPPALRWSASFGEWRIDNSRGLALGIMPHPELNASEGVLAPGEALMFYTDGVVETPTNDLDEGIGWLRGVAQRAFLRGVDGAARRIISQVSRGDDDRAIMILSRAPDA
ncbi:PP2C family protein-serine/threonine phosphatase [soil metagenome]